MTTIATHKNSGMKTPYSLRRFRNNTDMQVNSPSNQNDVEQSKQQPSSTSFQGLINQEGDSDDEEHDHEENIDFIDNIAIYSFSDMHKLKNFYEQNQLKLASEKKLKSKESDQSYMNKYLKKLDDTMEQPNNYKQSEVLVWQPNIEKTPKSHSTSQMFRSHSVASDSISMGSVSSDTLLMLPECGKAHCKLGCICETLTQCEYPSDSDSSNNKYERGHCGLIDCMFVCNCSRKLRNREAVKSDKNAGSEEINLRTRTKTKRQQQQARRKSQEAADANRRISKRLKTSICKLNKKANKANSSKKSNKKSTTASSSTTTSPSKKSKSILNKSRATSNYSLDNADGSSSSSSSEEGESSHSKQAGYGAGIFSDAMHQDKDVEEEASNEQGCATRKSKRVKILNKKFNNDENVAHLPLNDFYYYSNKSLKPKSSKVLNNRVNENFTGSGATGSAKKDKIKKLGKEKKSAKNLRESTENKSEFQEDLNENSTTEDFEPYTKNVMMRITNNVNPLDSQYPQSSQPSTSNTNNNNSYYTKMPLAIKCYTSIWESDPELRMQVLKKIAKMLQHMAPSTHWSNLDFEYEALSIKLVNAQPILVKVYKNRKLSQHTAEDGENRSILSLNDLVSTSLKIRSKLYSDQEETNLKVNSEALHSNQQQQYYSKFENLQLNTKPGSRPLPRLIIRKRTSKPIDQTQQTNKTGVLLKQVDTLFQQMKSNGTFPTIASKRVDTYDTISKSVLNMRLHSVNASQLVKRDHDDLLFRDEVTFFSKHIANKETSLIEYPFYNPFSDNDLVLGMYKEHGSRTLVDTVCDMVNDMITACCKLEEKLGDEKMSQTARPISQFVKPNIIRSRPTILNHNRVPVIITAVKKTELSKSPSPENISPTPKKNLVYKIINSSNMLKNTNPSSHSPPSVLYINKPTVATHDKSVEKSNGARLPQLSTVQLERTESLESDVTSEGEKTSLPVETPVATERQLQITGIKAILPSTKIPLNYKTLVKIVAPEKNNPEGIPKIKISSSYLMPASACLPKSVTTATANQAMPKLVTMPLKSPTQMSSNFLSSFVPIKPKNHDEAPTTNFLKSIVRTIPTTPSTLTRPTQQPETTKFTLTNDYPLSSNSLSKAIYHPRQPSPMITRVLSNTSKAIAINNNTEQQDSGSDSSAVIEIEKQVYLENRKRKRKQDLSSLKSLNNYLNDSQYDESLFFNPDDISIGREVSLRSNQMEDGSFYFRPQYNVNEVSPAKKQCSLYRFDSGNNSAFKSSSMTLNRSNAHNQLKTKNFSSSPDSNESLYSSSTPLPFEANRYEKSTLIQYREDSDDNEYVEENNNNNNNYYQLHTGHQDDEDDNDVIEIDSFDNITNHQRDYNLSDCYAVETNVDGSESYWNHKDTTDIRDSDDSDEDSYGRITMRTKGMEKSTVNNIHSIRERQRRLKLKNLLMKLKIQLFEAESDSKYDLDSSESQIRLDEYCNTRNFKKTSLKSKQNILQEAVNLIKKLQDQQVVLEHMRRKEKLELEKNIGIKNYLLGLQNK